MTSPHRRLTFSERSFIQPESQEIVGFGLALRGKLDVVSLTRANRALRREYPILAASVEPDGDDFVFVVGDQASDARPLVRVREASWRFDDLVQPDFDGTQTLSLIDVTSDGDRHRVIFWTSHAVADGNHNIFLCLRLWSLYAQFAQTGTADEEAPRPFPRPPHEVLATRKHVAGDPPYLERLTGTVWGGSLPTAAELEQLDLSTSVWGRLLLDARASAAIRAAAKEQGLSVHAIVAGAVAVAERGRFVGLPEDEAVPLGLLTPVDFKSRLSPPIHITEVTTLIGFSPVRVDVTARSDPAAVGRRVFEQLRHDIENEVVLVTSVSPMPDLSTRPYGPPIVVSNVGSLSGLPLPPELLVEDGRSYIAKNFRALPGFIASFPDRAEPPVPEASLYFVGSILGKLSIEVRNTPGTISREAQDAVLAKIRDLLLDFARESVPNS